MRDELFPRVDPIGRTITIGGTPFEVIGLLAKQGSVLGQSQDNVVYIPRETLCKVWGANRQLGILRPGEGRRARRAGVDGRDPDDLPGDPAHGPEARRTRSSS